MAGKPNTAHPIEPNYTNRVNLRVMDGGKGIDILEKKEFGKPIRQHVYEFGVVVAAVLVIISAFQLWNGKLISGAPSILLSVATVFFIFGKFAPRPMVPVWRAWIKFGGFLELIMSNVILISIWVGMFIPMSLLLRVIGKEPISKKFKTNAPSYWEERSSERDDMKLLERQF